MRCAVLGMVVNMELESLLSSSHGVLLCVGTTALCGLGLAFFMTTTSHVPVGLPRLLALSPFLPAFFILPSLVPSPNSRGILAFILCWTCPSKLFLLCFNHFLDSPSWLLSDFSHFLLAFLLPLRVRGLSTTKSSASWLPLFYFLSLLFSFNLCTFLHLMPPSVMYALYSVMLFLGLQVAHWIFAAFLYALFMVDVDPVFNHPFAASSLTDFWGTRWNLIVVTMLRATVYNPLVRFLSGNGAMIASGFQEVAKPTQLPVKPKLWARAVALWASFLVSGLFHELIFACFTKAQPTGHVTAFFVLHGFATSMEVAIRRLVPSHRFLKVPRALSAVATLAFLYGTAIWLFFPALLDSKTDLRCIEEFLRVQDWVMSSVYRWWRM